MQEEIFEEFIFADVGIKNSMFVRNLFLRMRHNYINLRNLFLRILLFSLNLRSKNLWTFKYSEIFLNGILENETFGLVIERDVENK